MSFAQGRYIVTSLHGTHSKNHIGMLVCFTLVYINGFKIGKKSTYDAPF